MRNPIAWLIDRRIAAFQRDLIAQHFSEVEHIYRQMRGWKHDYHNHIQAIKVLAGGTNEALDVYLRDLDADLTRVDTILKTGNIMIDAILNSKLSLARERGITVNARAFVPAALGVSDVDLCVILGNLLDNAMEACMELEEDAGRFIRLYIDVMKGQLYLSISNAARARERHAGGFQTTKPSGTHGFGLMRVDRLVQKYGGYINRQSEEGIFATEIMLPLA